MFGEGGNAQAAIGTGNEFAMQDCAAISQQYQGSPEVLSQFDGLLGL